CAALSKRDVCEAFTFGKPLPLALYARLSVGNGGAVTGSFASPHASTSLSPVRERPLWMNVKRSRSVVTSLKRTVFARRPSGPFGAREISDTTFHASPSHASTVNDSGGPTAGPSSRKYSFAVCSARFAPSSSTSQSLFASEPSNVQRFG